MSDSDVDIMVDDLKQGTTIVSFILLGHCGLPWEKQIEGNSEYEVVRLFFFLFNDRLLLGLFSHKTDHFGLIIKHSELLRSSIIPEHRITHDRPRSQDKIIIRRSQN